MILMTGKNKVLASSLLLGLLSLQTAVANKTEAPKLTVKSDVKASTTLFTVIHVKKNDSLNVRSGAGVSNEIVTTIPADGEGIEWLGDESILGKTHWVLIKWKGLTGWVSRYYLAKDEATLVTSKKEKAPLAKASDAKTDVEMTVASSPQKENNSSIKAIEIEPDAVQQSDNKAVTKENATSKEEWVLRCGNKTPYWKVDVHPKWMDVFKGEYETGLPITKKEQDKNRWNTALKTVVHGRSGKNKLEMTIKYAYSKRCYDTLSGLRVPYKVKTKFNGEELTGCCRAVKLETSPSEEDTKISMK